MAVNRPTRPTNGRASSLAVSSSPIPPPSWEGGPSISIGFESDGTWTEGLKLPGALQCNSQPVDGKKRKFRTTKQYGLFQPSNPPHFSPEGKQSLSRRASPSGACDGTCPSKPLTRSWRNLIAEFQQG